MTGDDHSPRIPPLPTLRRYYGAAEDRPKFVASLFDSTAAGYDRASAVLSFGTDRSYRRRALIEHGAGPGMKVLDVGCGTGLVAGPAGDIVGPGGLVIGIDPSAAMLKEGVAAGRLLHPVRGQGETLPFPDQTFDLVCMGYALRHLSDLLTTFREFHRVLRPGGIIVLLEITEPAQPLSRVLHRFYMRRLVPLVAGIATMNPRIAHLMTFYSDTIAAVVSPEIVLDAMRRGGFATATRHVKLGVFSEYVGQRQRLTGDRD